MNRTKGFLVTIDGPNGVGKSDVINGVVTNLIQMGYDIIKTKEPTSTALGKYVRKNEEAYSGKVLAHLVAADRCLHIETEIKPALEEGKIVVSDRYIESSLVLQCLDGLEMEYVWRINSPIVFPHLSVILTAKPSIIEQRMENRKKLGYFERNFSAAEEVEAYKKAFSFLKEKDFDIKTLDNGDIPLDYTIEKVTELILSVVNSAKQDQVSK